MANWSVWIAAGIVCLSSLMFCYEEPIVFVTLLVRNKAHTLPFFLKLFEELEYPKDRMILWIQSDGNQDDTAKILNKWIPQARRRYRLTFHDVKEAESGTSGPIETHWTPDRHRHVINLKEDALQRARHFGSEYIWFLDCDVFLTNPQTLGTLIWAKESIVAPMLDSLSLYSNFWAAMGPDYYYKRISDYKKIRSRKKPDWYQVPVVHSCVLVHLNSKTEKLTFKSSRIADYDGPEEDTITFAVSAERNGIPMYLSNEETYGFIMTPLHDGQTIEDDYIQLANLKHLASVDFPPMEAHELLTDFVKFPPKDRLGFDEIFMINLERRPERRRRMEWSFRELGLDFKYISAVDGKQLNASYIDSLGIRMLPNYEDPHHHRPMKMGEIGCFLSHYFIWKEIVERKLEKNIIFEDDVHFTSNFRQKLTDLMDETKRLNLDWDLIYLGRKIISKAAEPSVDGSELLIHVGYTHWTLGYVLTYRGAQKLLEARPLAQMVPVDEYLPIMYNRHPESRWVSAFPNRNLKAFAPYKLLIHPTQYFGDSGYISDTEWSEIIPESTRTNPTNWTCQSDQCDGNNITVNNGLNFSESHTEL